MSKSAMIYDHENITYFAIDNILFLKTEPSFRRRHCWMDECSVKYFRLQKIVATFLLSIYVCIKVILCMETGIENIVGKVTFR
jgi:hypothetical protein